MELIEKQLKALADSTRLQIIDTLAHKNLCAGALATRLQVSEAAISQHLKILTQANLLKPKKQGYFKHYQLNSEAIQRLSKFFLDLTFIARSPCNPEEYHCKKDKQNRCPVYIQYHGLEK